MKLPAQPPPVRRSVGPATGNQRPERGGVGPSQTSCDGLTGLAQQMCYAVSYGVS